MLNPCARSSSRFGFIAVIHQSCPIPWETDRGGERRTFGLSLQVVAARLTSSHHPEQHSPGPTKWRGIIYSHRIFLETTEQMGKYAQIVSAVRYRLPIQDHYCSSRLDPADCSSLRWMSYVYAISRVAKTSQFQCVIMTFPIEHVLVAANFYFWSKSEVPYF